MILCKVLVPLLAALGDPLCECITGERVDNVADVLPWHLADLPHDWQGVLDGWVGEAEVEDEVKSEVLVLRYEDVLDVLAVDCLEEIGMRIRNLPSCLHFGGP